MVIILRNHSVTIDGQTYPLNYNGLSKEGIFLQTGEPTNDFSEVHNVITGLGLKHADMEEETYLTPAIKGGYGCVVIGKS